LILALAKNLVVQYEKLKDLEWDQRTVNREIRNMTAAIVGYGGIGRAVADLLQPMGVRIIAVNRTGHAEDGVEAASLDDLQRVLGASDIVVLTLPLTKRTEGLIGSRELGWMKPDAILINVARGKLIDEEALYLRAQENPNFLVGLDVWWDE